MLLRRCSCPDVSRSTKKPPSKCELKLALSVSSSNRNMAVRISSLYAGMIVYMEAMEEMGIYPALGKRDQGWQPEQDQPEAGMAYQEGPYDETDLAHRGGQAAGVGNGGTSGAAPAETVQDSSLAVPGGVYDPVASAGQVDAGSPAAAKAATPRGRSGQEVAGPDNDLFTSPRWHTTSSAPEDPQVLLGLGVRHGTRLTTGARLVKGDRSDLLVLESCHSTWLFDPKKMRFRRILKGLDLDVQQASTGWRDYFGIELDPDSESFVVLLNKSGTRLLRSWRHLENCRQCGTESTSELSLAELRKAAGA